MRPRDWFGIAVRVLGVWVLLATTTDCVATISAKVGWLRGPVSPQYHLAMASTGFIVGLVLLLGADLIVAVSYWSANDRDNQLDDR